MKKALQRALVGFPLGVFIGYTITVIIALGWGKGQFYPAEPSLITSMGSEMNAVVLQYILSGLLGMGFAASSLVWENENWSLLTRTLAHLGISSVLMFPIAWLTHWMEHSLAGVASYILVFIGFYALIWLAQWFAWMRKIRDINRRLQRK